MALAALTAYQAVLLTPILAVYVWLFTGATGARWLVLLVPPLTVAAWQVFERFSTGALPAAVLDGYLGHGYQTLAAKLASAVALAIHSWFIVFPALVPGALVLAWRQAPRTGHAVPAGMDRDLLRRRAGDFLRRLGPLPAAHGGAGGAAGIALAS